MQWAMLGIGLVIGAALGAAVIQLRGRARAEKLRIRIAELESEQRAHADKLQWTENAKNELRDTFRALASDSLTTNSRNYLDQAKNELANLVKPLNESLEKMDANVRSMESKREGAYGSLGQQLQSLQDAQSKLERATVSLEQSLKSSTVRGRWGELQLRRVVELAGLRAHVDFEEQATTDTGRPDMTVTLPNGGIIAVDAKASAAAYLEAMQQEGEARAAKLADHARALKSRIQDLSKKQYWAQFAQSPELVVMFVPLESALAAAFDRDPELLEYGMAQHVLVASPVTLLALLRAIAFGWQQRSIAENAQDIAAEGKQLYDRVVTFLTHLASHGKNLDKSVDSFNSAVASLQSRLMPSLSRFKELNAATRELPQPEPIDHQARLPLDPES